MIESFVDLTYRGLSLGRRVKLTQVRPSTGYVETPAPMPVGTAIQIATDEGLLMDAMVMAIHEQVGGSDRVPGMVVAPTLEDEARQTWWKARVALPEEPPASTRVKPITVRPRTHTVPAPPPEAALAAAAEAVLAASLVEPADGKTVPMQVIKDDEPPDGRTKVMDAIDPEMLEQLTRKSDQIPAIRTTGEHAVVDDGQRTMVMDAVDPAALGLDVGTSGSMAAASDDDDEDPPRSSPGLPGSVKKRKKKR
jgi:hypothetical protein